MDELEAIVTRFRTEYYDSLSRPARVIIKSDWEDWDKYGPYFMEVDDFLQFTLIDGLEIPEDFLDQIEEEIRSCWDPDLTERTLGWVAKHRAKNNSRV